MWVREGDTIAQSGASDDKGLSARPLRALAAEGLGRTKEQAATRHQRVPPPAVEPRVPFTTRITWSTKERLEEACHVLRRKQQDFIDEAIQIHLNKYGF